MKQFSESKTQDDKTSFANKTNDSVIRTKAKRFTYSNTNHYMKKNGII